MPLSLFYCYCGLIEFLCYHELNTHFFEIYYLQLHVSSIPDMIDYRLPVRFLCRLEASSFMCLLTEVSHKFKFKKAISIQ